MTQPANKMLVTEATVGEHVLANLPERLQEGFTVHEDPENPHFYLIGS